VDMGKSLYGAHQEATSAKHLKSSGVDAINKKYRVLTSASLSNELYLNTFHPFSTCQIVYNVPLML
jgi:hypothetical protein